MADTPFVTNAPLEPRKENETAEEAGPLRKCVGLPNYVAAKTRPDIVFALKQVAQCMNDPCMRHYEAVAQIIRYLAGTRTHGIRYKRGGQHIAAFAHADWGKNDAQFARPSTGVLLYAANRTIHWSSVRQPKTSLSPGSAEIMAVSDDARAVVGCRNLLQTTPEQW